MKPESKNQDMPRPLHWRKPRLSIELITQGGTIAHLAVELARLARLARLDKGNDAKQTPAEHYLNEAWGLLQKACELVPYTVNITTIPEHERDEYSREAIAAMTEEDTVPWNDICAEGSATGKAPVRDVQLEKDGKPLTYPWKAYIQIDKPAGLRALLLRHAERMAFVDGNARKDAERLAEAKAKAKALVELETILATRYFSSGSKAKAGMKPKGILPKNTRWGEWTRDFMAQTLKANLPKKSERRKAWAQRIVQEWKQRCVKDFAARLLDMAKSGQMSVVTFESIALTRKLHPPGGLARN